MRRLKKGILASAVALAFGSVSGQAAAQFSNFYFLGDSLTDAGTYGARFTVNPGPFGLRISARSTGSRSRRGIREVSTPPRAAKM